MKIYFKKIFYLIVLSAILVHLIKNNKIYFEHFNGNEFKNILTENFYSKSLSSKEFVFNANYGILTQSIPNKINENPEISVVVPMFNTENLIRRCIISIQNQNYSDLEIIIVNDFSNDTSLFIVNNLSKKDKRIKIINNSKNMGLLYSRCIGTLFSKGKYIYPLDSDDMYLIHDILDCVNNEIERNKPDFLYFRGILALSLENYFKNKSLTIFRDSIKNSNIIYQPTLGKNCYKKCSLQAYSINSNLYKNVINFYAKKKLKEHITYYEDCIINYIIHQIAKSCEQYVKIGYLYIYRESSSSHTVLYLNRIKSTYYYLETVFLYSIIPSKNKIFAIQDLNLFIQNGQLKSFIKEEKNKKLVDLLLRKIILDKSIPNENKTLVKMFMNETKNRIF